MRIWGWSGDWTHQMGDWTHQIVPYEAFPGWLMQQGSVRFPECVVQVVDAEQTDAMSSMLPQYPVCAVLAVWAQASGSMSAPGCVAGRVSVKHVATKQLCRPASREAPQLRRPAPASPPRLAPSVVRVAGLRRCMEEAAWQELQARPRQAVMLWWSRELPSTAAAQLEDAWGFAREQQAQQDQVVGLIRVRKAALPAVVAASGRSGVFTEVLRWGPPLPETVVRWEPAVVGEDA